MLTGVIAQDPVLVPRRTLAPRLLFVDDESINGFIIGSSTDTILFSGLVTDADSTFSTDGFAWGLTSAVAVDVDNLFLPSLFWRNQVLSASIYFASDIFYLPGVHIAGALQTNPYIVDDVFYVPSILAPGSLTSTGLWTDLDTFFAPVLSTPQTILPVLWNETDNFYAPLVRQNVIGAPLYQVDDIVYASTLIRVPPLVIAPLRVDDNEALPAPVVSGPPIISNFGPLTIGTSATAASLPLPSSPVIGDVLIAFVQTITTGKTFSVSSGWTLGDTSANGASTWAWCVYDGTQSAPAFGWTGISNWQGQTLRIIRASDVPIGAHSTSRGFGTTLSISHLITTSDPDLTIAILLANSVNTTIPLPSGFALNILYHDNTSSGLVCSQSVSPIGASTSDISVTIPSAEWSAFLIEITTFKSVHPALYADADTFFVPAIPQLVTFLPALWTDTDVLYTPIAVWNQFVPLDLWDDTDIYHAPLIAPPVPPLEPVLFADSDIFYAPAFLQFFVLDAQLWTDVDAFPAPTVTTGAITLAPSLLSDNDIFSAPDIGPEKFAQVDLYTSGSGNWTKPSWANWVHVVEMGGGGGGGGGDTRASATFVSGGAGGGGGARAEAFFPASSLGSTEAYVVGGGGAAGTAGTGSGGGNGGNGGNSTFGGTVIAVHTAYGGGGGVAGSSASVLSGGGAGLAGAASLNTGGANGGVNGTNGNAAGNLGCGGSSGVTSNAGVNGAVAFANIGGGGGGVGGIKSATPAYTAGSAGCWGGSNAMPGSGGAASTGSATTNKGGTSDISDAEFYFFGGSGGGGGGADAVTAGAGGDGGFGGGGGGGGGASITGGAANVGGAGGSGFVLVISYR